MRDRRGLVLVIVLVFALLLSGSLVTFVRRATVDAMIVRNRDHAAAAEALARGGVRLGVALLLEDALRQKAASTASGAAPGETLDDLWARVSAFELPAPGDARLRLRIEDAGARLNLNAVLAGAGESGLAPEAVAFLTAVLEKVIAELPLAPGEKTYDPRALAENLIDWIDADEVSLRGGAEDAEYQRRSPPYRAANRPLLSLDELRMVEGFDGRLVEALRPYATVYPYHGGSGVNLNTAPPHVLALVYHGLGEDRRLASEDTVRNVLRERAEGRILCEATEADGRCTFRAEVVEGEIFPPLPGPVYETDVFTIAAEATVGELRRTVEAVIDRSDPTQPLVLSWRTR
jgi:general secretion pathway protein K